MLDYTMIRLLYTVFGLSPREIAATMAEKTAVVETAVYADLGLTDTDRHKYDDMSLLDKLKLLDLERVHAFQIKYVQIESLILDRVLQMLRTDTDEPINATAIGRLAATLSLLRRPTYGGGDDSSAASSLTSVDCAGRAAEAARKLDEIRRMRMV